MLLTLTAALVGGPLSARIAWQDLAPLPVGVAGGSVALLDGTKLVYAGGTTWVDGVKHWLRDVRRYDLALASWNSGPPLPEPLAYGGSIPAPDGLEIFGGMNEAGPSRNCWRLDLRRQRWVASGRLPRNAVLARVMNVDGVPYLFGGCSDVAAPMHCSDDVWTRSAQGDWTRIGVMPGGAIAVRAAVVSDGRVYLFGGCSESPSGVLNRDDAFRFDPASREWRKLRPLPVPVRGLSAASLSAGRILLVGGYTGSARDAATSRPEYGFSSQVWIYDTASDRYTSATPLPFAASGIELAIREGTILVLGGEDRMRGRSRRCLQGKFE